MLLISFLSREIHEATLAEFEQPTSDVKTRLAMLTLNKVFKKREIFFDSIFALVKSDALKKWH